MIFQRQKSLDIGKLLFMGYVSENEQKNLIDKIIDSLGGGIYGAKKIKRINNISKKKGKHLKTACL